MKTLKKYLMLFWTMFKIGLFTFGGGYAMIAIIERELVEKKKWLEKNEFLDLIALAESSPGPIAINSATYIGYKIGKVFGSVLATLGVVLPSFIIIFVISLFFEAFLSLEYVNYAFRGIQAAVAFLILSAGIKMAKHIDKKPINIILIIVSVSCLIAFTLFAIDFSTIFYILIGGGIGLIIYLVSLTVTKIKGKKAKDSINYENIEDNENNKEGDK